MNSLHSASYTLHQVINRFRRILDKEINQDNCHQGTSQNRSQNSLINIGNQSIHRILCNKTAQCPLGIFIRHISAVQLQIAHKSVNLLFPNSGSLCQPQSTLLRLLQNKVSSIPGDRIIQRTLTGNSLIISISMVYHKGKSCIQIRIQIFYRKIFGKIIHSHFNAKYTVNCFIINKRYRICDHLMVIHIEIFQNKRLRPVAQVFHTGVGINVIFCCYIWLVKKVIGSSFPIALEVEICMPGSIQ